MSQKMKNRVLESKTENKTDVEKRRKENVAPSLFSEFSTKTKTDATKRKGNRSSSDFNDIFFSQLHFQPITFSANYIFSQLHFQPITFSANYIFSSSFRTISRASLASAFPLAFCMTFPTIKLSAFSVPAL